LQLGISVHRKFKTLTKLRRNFLCQPCYTIAFAFLACLVAFAQESPKPEAFSQFRPRKEIAGQSFVGSEVCLNCHGLKAGLYLHTSMAHALALPSDSAVLASHPRLTFRSGPYSYEIVKRDQQTLYRVTDRKETIEEPILYAFGNAHIAQTYIFQRKGTLYEGRVSYYAASDNLDWTIGDAMDPPPNLLEAAGRDISGDEARNCFSCHATNAVVDGRLSLESFIPGVGCEACHGPGQAHVKAARVGSPQTRQYIFNPGKLDPEKLSQEFCGACHRGVDTVAMMPNLGGITNVRFQPYRLFNSRGHSPQDARFSCTACHDPHVELKHENPAYDAGCKTCHSGHGADRVPIGAHRKSASGQPASSAAKPCPEASDHCVTCHMPKVGLPGAHFKFTDHRIRIARVGEPYPY
jgi:Cytochrome c554 and c-prime